LTGKTTLVRELTTTLTERGIPTRPHTWMLARRHPFAAALRRLPRVRQPDSGAITAALLGPGYLLDGLLVRWAPPDQPGEVIIQDGYADRCAAFGMAGGPHLAACLALRWRRMFAPFDIAVYLHAPAEVRGERLAARPDPDAGDRRSVEDRVFAETFAAMLVQGMGKRHRELRVFDTSRHAPADIAAEVADLVKPAASPMLPQRAA
jgi:dTMP kinase